MPIRVEPILVPPSNSGRLDGGRGALRRHRRALDQTFGRLARGGGRGQVSSPVEVLDPERRLARTRSGRVYELREGPGLNADAFTTWCRWKGQHSLNEERDASDEVAALLG